VDRLIDGWEDERAPPIVIGLMPWESLDQNIQAELTERPTGTCYTVPARRLNDGLCDGGLCRRHAFLLMHEKRQGDESDSPDEDGAAKCAGGVDCAGISTYSKCIDDAGCCDYEKDGAKMKDMVAALFTIASCTTTNECA
jgi:hypothetical protein